MAKKPAKTADLHVVVYVSGGACIDVFDFTRAAAAIRKARSIVRSGEFDPGSDTVQVMSKDARGEFQPQLVNGAIDQWLEGTQS